MSQLFCLGFAETPFFSVAAVVADAMGKSAGVRLLGLEPGGTEWILIRVGGGDVSDVEAAVQAAEEAAGRMRAEIVTATMARPSAGIHSLNAGPLIYNGLYGGREEMRPSDFQRNLEMTMSDNVLALGILETQGLTASLEATDAMLKAADVSLVGKEKIGAAYVTVIVKGDVAAVKAAVEAGSVAGAPFGKVIAAHVIARPHQDLLALLPG